MAIEVYWGSGSMPAWRALLGFRLKGVPYEGHLLSFSARDTQKPEFLALNPRGKVPTVREGDFTLNESFAILAWLEARTPEPPLFGRGAAEHGQVWRHMMEYESHGNPTFGAVARPILFKGVEGATLTEPLAAVVQELDRLAARVSGPGGARPLVGATVSAADIVWYTGLRYLERAATRPKGAALGLSPFGERWPALVEWGRLVEAIPGFEETFPPHWREGDNPSALRLG